MWTLYQHSGAAKPFSRENWIKSCRACLVRYAPVGARKSSSRLRFSAPVGATRSIQILGSPGYKMSMKLSSYVYQLCR